MKYYLLYTIIIICLFFISCEHVSVIKVTVHNNSGAPVDSVQVWIADSTQTFNKSLPTGKKELFTVDFSNVPANDGSMIFKFYKRDGQMERYDIYYSNGIALDYDFALEVLPDSIKMVHD